MKLEHARCAACHDVLTGLVHVCACGTIVHTECGDSLSRCSTLGCGRRPSPARRDATARAVLRPTLLLIAGALSCVLGLQLGQHSQVELRLGHASALEHPAAPSAITLAGHYDLTLRALNADGSTEWERDLRDLPFVRDHPGPWVAKLQESYDPHRICILLEQVVQEGAPLQLTAYLDRFDGVLCYSSGGMGSPVAPVTSILLSTDSDPSLSQKLDGGHLQPSQRDLSVSDLFREVARQYGTSVAGLGRWSDRLRVRVASQPKWTTTQVLNATRNECGRFDWGSSRGRLEVHPVSHGDPLVLEEEDNLTVELLADKQTVQATEVTGRVLWKTNVIQACGPDLFVVNSVSAIFPCFKKGYVFVAVHAAIVSLDLKTGRATFEGSD